MPELAAGFVSAAPALMLSKILKSNEYAEFRSKGGRGPVSLNKDRCNIVNDPQLTMSPRILSFHHCFNDFVRMTSR